MTFRLTVCPAGVDRGAGSVCRATAARLWLCGVVAVIAALAAAHGLNAQSGGKATPHSSPADVAEGAASFRHHCAGCHGPNGQGGRAPDLKAVELHHGDGPEDLFQVVRFGVPGTEMSGTRFPDKRVWQIVAYLRSLRRRVSQPRIRGDRLRGKALFEGRGGCMNCHWVNGNGGRLGPELSRVGAGLSLDGLRSALVNPNKDVAPEYWQWKAVHKDGKTVSGIRLHEDNFSIRLLDSEENLVSLDKESLNQIQRQRISSMPGYGETLSSNELDDLVAFLHSLR